MNSIVSFVVIGFVVLRVIWGLTRNQRPVSSNGLSILYPLFVYLILVIFAASKVFVNHSGALVLPSVSLIEVLGTLILGGVLAIPVLLTTNYEFKQNAVYVKKNKTFVYVIIGVIALRLALRSILFAMIPSADQLFLTLVMATVYMVIWRVGSFMKFYKLSRGTAVN